MDQPVRPRAGADAASSLHAPDPFPGDKPPAPPPPAAPDVLPPEIEDPPPVPPPAPVREPRPASPPAIARRALRNGLAPRASRAPADGGEVRRLH